MSYLNKKKSMPKNNLYLSQFIFNAPIGILWNIIKDPTHIQNFNKGNNFLNLNDISINNNIITSYEIGTIFQNCYNKSSHFIYEIENIIETDYFCEIIWKCSLINNTLNLPHIKCIFDLYYNENKTIFTAKYIFPKYYNKKFLLEQEKKRQKYYNSIEKVIKNDEYLKNFILSITIKGDFYKAYRLLYDIKLMTSLYSDILKYNSNLFEKNNELIIKIKNKKFYNGKDVIVKYKVGELIKNESIPKILFELFMNSMNSKGKIIVGVEKNKLNSFNLFIFVNFFQISNPIENYFWKSMTKKFLLKIREIFKKVLN
jgi:hypothetical protein